MKYFNKIKSYFKKNMILLIILLFVLLLILSMIKVKEGFSLTMQQCVTRYQVLERLSRDTNDLTPSSLQEYKDMYKSVTGKFPTADDINNKDKNRCVGCECVGMSGCDCSGMNSLSTGAIIGIVIGVLALILLIGFFVMKSRTPSTPSNYPQAV